MPGGHIATINMYRQSSKPGEKPEYFLSLRTRKECRNKHKTRS